MKIMTKGLMMLLVAAPAFADPTTQPTVVFVPATQPATQPAVVLMPTTQPGWQLKNPDATYAIANDICPGQVSTVASVLRDMDAAYAKLNTVQVDGRIAGSFDVSGEQKTYDESFTSLFSAPNQFRHDVANDILLGSTGSTVFALLAQRNEYQTFDAPRDRGTLKDWPASIAEILSSQNPSLELMLCKSASAELNGLTRHISLEPVTLIDGVKYDTLRFDIGDDHQIVTMLVDPNTRLLYQVQFDNSKPLEKAGAADVKSAVVTITYGRYRTDAVPADQFAWTAPVGAVQQSTAVAMAGADDGLADELKALIGKTAPDFTLSGLDDQTVTLSALKGSVVVLDFWATWCGPCVASLPHLDALYCEQGPNGLKVFALNQREAKPAVSNFVQKKGWSIPVLLDSAGAVAGNYKVTGIPQTVVIGKDGTVKQIFVGSGQEKQIAAAVAKEMQ